MLTRYLYRGTATGLTKVDFSTRLNPGAICPPHFCQGRSCDRHGDPAGLQK